MKKYIPVFGPQELFDGGPEDAVIAIKQPALSGSRIEETFFFPSAHEAVVKAVTSFNLNHNILNRMEYAERRIEETPVWTAEDKASVRYPPVGISALVSGVGACEVIGVDEKHEQIAIKYQDGSFDIVGCAELTPVETPEQLANALRDIWVSRVREDVCYHHTGDAEVTRSIGMIYDALLSGELPPVQAKDGA